jgi:predicted transcriptional regulator
MGEEHEGASAPNGEVMRMTAEIVASFAGNNKISSQELVELIRNVHRAVSAIADGAQMGESERPKPAAPINKSVHSDYIICLEDGKKLKMLKRYLRSNFNLTPDEYRKRWGLAPDYPMVAPAYAARRSEFAKRIGLGRGVRRKG